MGNVVLCVRNIRNPYDCLDEQCKLTLYSCWLLEKPNATYGSISGPQLPVKSSLLFFFSNCDILGVKIIRIDPLEPNLWLYYVYYAVLQLFF